jgi:tungstate transport system permease protein
MEDLAQGLVQALRLIIALDPNVLRIVSLSFQITGIALLFSILLGIPLGSWLGLKRFLGRRLAMAVVYTGMGFPPVVVGLFVYLTLSRSGPLGGLGWLFTPKAMVLAQAIISFPMVSGFTMASVMGVDPDLRHQLLSLGATDWQATLTILVEAKTGIIASIVAGFGSIISEVGAVMLVGGNIERSTRVLTTAIVLETRKGNFALAMALGVILLALSFAANLTVLHLQGELEG